MGAGQVRFPTIQKLRAVAALAIVGVHLYPQLQRLGYAGPWPDLTAGVDLFFVISGFIMWVTTANRPVGPRDFILRRLIRIVPLYWLLTLFVVAIGLVAPSLLQSTLVSPAYVVKSLLFIPAEHPLLRGEFLPVLPPGWTLELELPFYGLVALALFLPIRIRLTVLLLALFTVAAAHLVVPPRTELAFLTDNIIIEFGFGLLIGALVISGASLPRWTGPVFIAAGLVGALVFIAIGSLNLIGAIMPGLPMAAIVLGAAICDVPQLDLRGAWLVRLGDASYALYLSHSLVLSAMLQAWRRVLPQAEVWNWVAFSLVATIVASLASLFLYRFVERPLGACVKRAFALHPNPFARASAVLTSAGWGARKRAAT